AEAPRVFLDARNRAPEAKADGEQQARQVAVVAFARDAHHRPGQRRAEQDAVKAGREGDNRPEADRLLQQTALAVRTARCGPPRRFQGRGRSTRVRHVSRSEEPSAMPARYTLHGIWASGPTYKVGLMLALA